MSSVDKRLAKCKGGILSVYKGCLKYHVTTGDEYVPVTRQQAVVLSEKNLHLCDFLWSQLCQIKLGGLAVWDFTPTPRHVQLVCGISDDANCFTESQFFPTTLKTPLQRLTWLITENIKLLPRTYGKGSLLQAQPPLEWDEKLDPLLLPDELMTEEGVARLEEMSEQTRQFMATHYGLYTSCHVKLWSSYALTEPKTPGECIAHQIAYGLSSNEEYKSYVWCTPSANTWLVEMINPNTSQMESVLLNDLLEEISYRQIGTLEWLITYLYKKPRDPALQELQRYKNANLLFCYREKVTIRDGIAELVCVDNLPQHLREPRISTGELYSYVDFVGVQYYRNIEIRCILYHHLGIPWIARHILGSCQYVHMRREFELARSYNQRHLPFYTFEDPLDLRNKPLYADRDPYVNRLKGIVSTEGDGILSRNIRLVQRTDIIDTNIFNIKIVREDFPFPPSEYKQWQYGFIQDSYCIQVAKHIAVCCWPRKEDWHREYANVFGRGFVIKGGPYDSGYDNTVSPIYYDSIDCPGFVYNRTAIPLSELIESLVQQDRKGLGGNLPDTWSLDDMKQLVYYGKYIFPESHLLTTVLSLHTTPTLISDSCTACLALFELAMYCRRWDGNRDKYPVTESETLVNTPDSVAIEMNIHTAIEKVRSYPDLLSQPCYTLIDDEMIPLKQDGMYLTIEDRIQIMLRAESTMSCIRLSSNHFLYSAYYHSNSETLEGLLHTDFDSIS